MLPSILVAQRAALDLGRPAGHVAEIAGNQRDIDVLGNDDRFAIVERFDFSQRPGVLFNQIGQPEQQTLPLIGPHFGPGRRLEGLTRSAYRAIDIAFGCRRHAAEQAFIRRIGHFQRLAGTGRDPLAADQHGMLAARQKIGGSLGQLGVLCIAH